jgi:hypothetical protein
MKKTRGKELKINTSHPLLIKEKGLLHYNMTSEQILKSLQEQHTKDVFISECKNGKTWNNSNLLKLDAWVLKRSYSPLTTIGYEIKISRQDFENDQKWNNYLSLCHFFSFVCPAGLIRNTDLPSNIGIIWVSNSGKLHVKHKPERNTPDPAKQNSLLIYALMSRSKIVRDMNEVNKIDEPAGDRIKAIREYLERCKENKELSRMIKGYVKDLYYNLQSKEDNLIQRERVIKGFEDRLSMLGITWDSTSKNWQDDNKVSIQINELKKSIDYNTIRDMKHLSQILNNTATQMENLIKG